MEKIFSLIDSSKNGALKKKIIQSLILSGNTSIADLAKEMELSIPTVTKLVSELLEDGYLLDIGKQNTNGGRKPNMYGLNPESGYFIGVDVQRKKLMLATIDFCGNIIDHEEVSYELENKPAALDVLCDTINMYIDNLSVPRDKILQVGVNIGGRVNTQSGYSYSYFYFDERPLSQIIGERIGVSVSIENDSRAMIYGEYISGVIHGEKNILFVGGTGTGKTTATNAVLDEIAKTGDRLVILEDTKELQCSATNVVFLRTQDNIDMTRLLKSTMRLRPDRIVVGEVRDGAALALLKAWNTGHPGGISTIHADNAYAGLLRLESLIQEAIPSPQPQLIAEAVDIVIYIERVHFSRKVKEMAFVNGYKDGMYQLEYIKE